MKIAISADGSRLDSTIHQRFARCPYFLIVDTDDMSVAVIENSNAGLSSGAGIQAASMVAAKGVDVVVTGNCGPNALRVFAQTGVQCILNQQGVVRDAVEKLKDGAPVSSPRVDAPESTETVPFSSQTVMGRGAGRGPGGGRGMGGCGRRSGMGGGRGMGRRYSGTGADGNRGPG